MASLSEYELNRLKNIQENNKILESLGLLHFSADDEEWTLPDDELDEDQKYIIRVKQNKENLFGHIPDIPVGTTWLYRIDCSADGVHRPTVAGIHGSDREGVYSIALSGGYEDDVDYGECFTYTGCGGRDLKGTKSNPKNLRTAKQSKDQELTKANLALTLNIEKKLPVRVIRGFKLQSPYAPSEGYRYDGLYDVLKYWRAPGLGGFAVYKYALRRRADQPPPPWTVCTEGGDDPVDVPSVVKVENGDDATTTDLDKDSTRDLPKSETEE